MDNIETREKLNKLRQLNNEYEIEKENFTNKRNHYRYKTHDKLVSKMEVLKIGDVELRKNELDTIIHDISEGGFSFLTDSYINLKNKVEVRVTFVLLETNIILEGEIVRLDKYIGDYTYLYGVFLTSKNIPDLFKHLAKTGINFEKVTVKNSSVIM